LEASGTSGMKSAPNGGIISACSMAGGREGFNGSNGWAIGGEIDDGSTEFQNEVDASSLYQLLENQIVPLYYAKTGRQTSPRLAAIDARINSQRHACVSTRSAW